MTQQDTITNLAAIHTPLEMLALLEDGEALARLGITDQELVEDAHFAAQDIDNDR